eukprot:Clim_evm57s201 gene=Clim_evmTU57s201
MSDRIDLDELARLVENAINEGGATSVLTAHRPSRYRIPLGDVKAAVHHFLCSTCYEYGHTWDPSCIGSTATIWWSVFRHALEIYGTLFFANSVLRGQGPKTIATKTVPAVLQSAVFLACYGGAFIGSFCLYRNILGRLYAPISGYTAGFTAGALSILVEKKSRRSDLAYYCLNHALSVVYNMYSDAGYLPKSIPGADAWIFGTAMALIMQQYNSDRSMVPGAVRPIITAMLEWGPLNGSGSISQHVERWMTGDDSVSRDPSLEFLNKVEDEDPVDHEQKFDQTAMTLEEALERREEKIRKRRRMLIFLSLFRVMERGTKAGLWTFLVAYGIRGTISGLGTLVRSRNPRKLYEAFAAPSTRNFALFLGLFAGVYTTAKGLLDGGVADEPQRKYRAAERQRLAAEKAALQVQLEEDLAAEAAAAREVLEASNSGCSGDPDSPDADDDAFSPAEIARADEVGGPKHKLHRTRSRHTRQNLDIVEATLGKIPVDTNVPANPPLWKPVRYSAALAGAVAGTSILFLPNRELSMFFLSKGIEVVVRQAMAQGYMPDWYHWDTFLFAGTCATIFHTALWSPHYLRRSYWNFLLRITENRFASMNRALSVSRGVDYAQYLAYSKPYGEYMWPEKRAALQAAANAISSGGAM